MPEYVPKEDQLALAFLLNFAQLLTERASAYGVGEPDALNVTRVVAGYADALAAIRRPSGKNRASVSLKDQAKATAIQLVRSFAMRIKADDGVSDQDKIDIGVRPNNPSRAPVPPPTTAPVLNIVGAMAGSQTVRFADAVNPEKRGRPWGVAKLELFVAVAAAPATDPSAARYLRGYGRGPVGVAFDAADDGKVATYFARWANARGDAGPWSAPASMRIAA